MPEEIKRNRRARHRSDDADAFLSDPTRPGARVNAADAESFGEEFVASATSGEPLHMDAVDEVADDEEGGPFLEPTPEEEAPAPSR